MLSAYALPQTDESKTDSTESAWNWDDWDEFHKDMDFVDSGSHGSPVVVLGYGISGLSLNQFNGKFADPNMVELKLGYIKDKNYKKQEDIIKYNFNYLYLSNISTELSSSNSGELSNNTWRFGIGNAKGYGYKIGRGGITPYYSAALTWSRLDLKEQTISTDQRQLLSSFDDSFRFGTNWEGGIKFKVIPMLTIDAGYERAVIFPRHLFWKWLGSAAIETAGQWMVDGFVKEIMKSSPYAGPVMSFVLKNALSYGMYELRQEKMNWPFKSAAPLAYDQFKFGFTVNF
jgi:opacity protein-like surface antigen